MHANGTTTGKVLSSLGIPTTACGRFLLWGACSDKECALSHDELKLTTAQVSQVKDILTDASKKITDKSERSWMPDRKPGCIPSLNYWQKTYAANNTSAPACDEHLHDNITLEQRKRAPSMSRPSESDRKRTETNKETLEKQRNNRKTEKNQKKQQTYTWKNKRIQKHRLGKRMQAFSKVNQPENQDKQQEQDRETIVNQKSGKHKKISTPHKKAFWIEYHFPRKIIGRVLSTLSTETPTLGSWRWLGKRGSVTGGTGSTFFPTVLTHTLVYFQLVVSSFGSEDEEDHDEMISQLVTNMEEMELDPVLMHLRQWVSTHFSIVKKIATLHDKRIEKET